MKLINIAVIGDIHYPQTRTALLFDAKHPSPSAARTGMAKTALSVVIDDLKASHEKRAFDCLLFVGDFTDQGDLGGFTDCLEYFGTALRGLRVPMIGVPGNHDLLYPDDFLDNDKKFDEFKKRLFKKRPRIKLSFEPLKEFSAAIGNGRIGIYALNSCMGCSELWESVGRTTLAAKLSKAGVGVPKDELYERFDAPYIDIKSIDKMTRHIAKVGITMPIILAHHNLFPQRIPRVAIFPELLNSGYIRDCIANLPSPVLYIHGHVHEDVVDVLSNPQQFSQVGIVSVSAPLITQGYPTIRLLVSKEEEPLAIRITKKQFAGTAVRIAKEISITFYNRETLVNLLPRTLTPLLDEVSSDTRIRYEDAIDRYGVDAVDHLECCGLIEIERGALALPQTWRIRGAA